MRSIPCLVAAAVFSVAFAGPARADDILLEDGTVYQGTVKEFDSKNVTIEVRMKSGGIVTMKLPSARLDAAYFYGLLDAKAGKDAKAHVDVALWAVERGLFSRAKAQMLKAEEIDPAFVAGLREGKFPEIREGIATQLVASAEADVKAGRLDAAQQKLEVLLTRLSDTEGGNKAREMLPSLEEQIEARDAKTAEEERAKLAETERENAEERVKRFAKFDAERLKARKIAVEGLTEDNDGRALDLLATALGKGEALLKDLDEMEKVAGEDKAFREDLEAWRKKIRAAMVKVHLHRCDIYVFRGVGKSAMEEVTAAKAIDPENPDVAAAEVRAARADEGDDDISDLRWRRANAAGGRFGRGGGGGGCGGGGRRR
jgi:hypothetical protein